MTFWTATDAAACAARALREEPARRTSADLAPTSADLVSTSPEETAQLAGLVADGGAIVSATTAGPADAGRGVRTVRVFTRSDAARLAELVARVDAGDLKLEVALPILEDRPTARLRPGRPPRYSGLVAQNT